VRWLGLAPLERRQLWTGETRETPARLHAGRSRGARTKMSRFDRVVSTRFRRSAATSTQLQGISLIGLPQQAHGLRYAIGKTQRTSAAMSEGRGTSDSGLHRPASRASIGKQFDPEVPLACAPVP